MGQVDLAINRLKRIDWEFENRYRPSHIVLVQEMIQREIRFLKSFHYEKDHKHVLWSPMRLVNLELPNIEEIYPEIEQVLKIDCTMKLFCTYYLEWAYFADRKEPFALRQPNLYEPIIRMFERGGRVYFRENFLMTGLVDIPRIIFFNRDFCSQDISDQALEQYEYNYYRKKAIVDQLQEFQEILDVEQMADLIMKKLEQYEHATSKEILICVELTNLIWEQKLEAEDMMEWMKWKLTRLDANELAKIPEAERKEILEKRAKVLHKLKNIGSDKM